MCGITGAQLPAVPACSSRSISDPAHPPQRADRVGSDIRHAAIVAASRNLSLSEE
jgi:hypothetical protein